MLTLMIRTSSGRYRAALPAEICEHAAQYHAQRIVGERLDTISGPRATKDFLRNQLAWRDSEAFAALFLDNRHRVIAFEILFRGTIDGASVHPREVVKRTIELNAAALIFAHNHPSGNPEPSRADESITTRLRDALALIDVRVLDHIVIAGNDCTSFAERGLL